MRAALLVRVDSSNPHATLDHRSPHVHMYTSRSMISDWSLRQVALAPRTRPHAPREEIRRQFRVQQLKDLLSVSQILDAVGTGVPQTHVRRPGAPHQVGGHPRAAWQCGEFRVSAGSIHSCGSPRTHRRPKHAQRGLVTDQCTATRIWPPSGTPGAWFSLSRKQSTDQDEACLPILNCPSPLPGAAANGFGAGVWPTAGRHAMLVLCLGAIDALFARHRSATRCDVYLR
jgi:hypothetical protein